MPPVWDWELGAQTSYAAGDICRQVAGGALAAADGQEQLLRLWQGAAAMAGVDLRPFLPLVRVMFGMTV